MSIRAGFALGWSEHWDRLIASDPGLGRLRLATNVAVGMSTALAVQYLFARALGLPPKLALICLLLGAMIVMSGAMALIGSDVGQKVRIASGFPIAFAVGLTSGVLVSASTTLMLWLFVLVMFISVYVRRFGLPYFFYGFMTWIGYFLASFLHLTWPILPLLLGSVLLGSAWLLLLSITVSRTNSQRALRQSIRAFDARARRSMRLGATLLMRSSDTALPQFRRALRGHRTRLDEAALIVEAHAAERGALPRGWSGHVLRRHIIDTQQTVDDLLAATDAMAGHGASHRDSAALLSMSASVLVRLARKENGAAEQAATALADAATEAKACGDESWWPALHLAEAALGYVRLVADPDRADPDRADPDRADPDRADPDRADTDFADTDRGERVAGPHQRTVDDEQEQFDPVVTLAMGALPGPTAVASEATAVGASWNPLARLSMSSRQAVQVAVAGGLAILIGRELSTQRYYWAVIAAFVMFAGTGTRSETFIKGFNRVLGTLVGLFAAIWIAEFTSGSTALTIIVIVASMFFGFYLMRVSYVYFIFFVTIMVGQLYSALGELSGGFLVLRLEETALGAVIGFAVAMLVLPLGTRSTVRHARDAAVIALAELLEAIADHRPGQELDGALRLFEDKVRGLMLVAKPLTRPLLWGNSPPHIRHRLGLYSTIAMQLRAVVVALRGEHVHPESVVAAATALAETARSIAATKVGAHDKAAREPLTRADEALFAARAETHPQDVHPSVRSMIALLHSVRELRAPKAHGAGEVPLRGERHAGNEAHACDRGSSTADSVRR